MAVSDRMCTSCDTPLPDQAAYCPICGVATPTGLSPASGTLGVPDVRVVDDTEHRERLQRAVGDGYELRELIGSGGFGSVYAARDVRLEREVAIKALRPDVFLASTLIKRFEREAQAVAKLRHPNIIPIYSIGEGEGLAYFVMPRIKGESLRAILEREGKLSVDETCRILKGSASALEAAHEAGIVHRDIKPENIMLEGGERRVLLMDFGVAKALDPHETVLTEAGTIVGTPQYMSPEQAVADRRIDHRSDIYSLGVVAYQMLSGRFPFEASSVHELLYLQVTEEPPVLDTIRPELPRGIVGIVMRCLRKDPSERWQSAHDLAAALEGSETTLETGPGGKSLIRRIRSWWSRLRFASAN